MNILLISANRETMNMPPLPLGPACVAAAARKAGHDAALLDLMFEEDASRAIRGRIAETRPDVIGVSVRNIDDQNMEHPRLFLGPVLEVVAACRSASRAPVVLGGAGYSLFPESALRYLGADMGVRGEGEAAFPALLGRMAAGAAAVGSSRDLPARDASGRREPRERPGRPAPAGPRLWIASGADAGNLWVPVQTRRGCPMDCIYCPNAAIEGRAVRRRSPERVVAWLTEMREAGCRSFNFVDNTFNLPPAYAKAICRAILRAGLDIDMWCIIYPKWVDGELVDLMARAGCRQVSLGFESGSDRMLRALNKRYCGEDVREVSGRFREAGVGRMGFLLLGGPGRRRTPWRKAFPLPIPSTWIP